MIEAGDVKSRIKQELREKRTSQSGGAEDAAPAKKRMSFFKKFLLGCLALFLLGCSVLAGISVWYYKVIYPTLPSTEQLLDVSLSIPVKVFTKDGKLITEIGEKKREPLKIDEIPQKMRQAVIAAEDANFYSHSGLDVKAIGRAALDAIKQGRVTQGGSTITMQVVRNFLLTREKTILRKTNEIILALKLEQLLSKEQILELYFNKIFFGYRSYGVAAAAKTYYGKRVSELTLDEMAMIAGLPKAPSKFNPVINPDRAKIRRGYVLGRMRALDFIDEAAKQQADAQPVHAKIHELTFDVEADYVAEMVRQFLIETYGADKLENGFNVYTTIDSHLQEKAQQSVRSGLWAYSRRHGYKGPLRHIDLKLYDTQEKQLAVLSEIKSHGDLLPSIVHKVNKFSAEVLLVDGRQIKLDWDGMSWASKWISVNAKGPKPKKASEILQNGDLILLRKNPDEQNATQWLLSQYHDVESALVSVKSHTGEVNALVGGFDYHISKFNRVTQAQRQLGSTFKPILYSAAMRKGYTSASLINDAPVVFKDKFLEDVWRPENYTGRSYGPTRLRVALAYSRNLVSIRLLQALGIGYVIRHAEKFGIPKKALNQHRNLSLSLGALSLTPMEVAQAYVVFSNGGYLVKPFVIDRVVDRHGEIHYKTPTQVKCEEKTCELDEAETVAPRVISPQNQYIMTSLLQDVIRIGSGKKAKALGRNDLAGKTGSTNDQKDAWFTGFNPELVTVVWTGFDQPQTMGARELGGVASLPTWIDYMGYALKDTPDVPFIRPKGLVNVRIDRETGLATSKIDNTVFEIFRQEHAPQIIESNEEIDEINGLATEVF